ncbi:head-tail adaptor protein [Macrococcus capreoli]|uniref:head-tail adaptor protein n=1 Tax=Macrococcus capreoli TaxID=2982690 RepID=UPI0021D5873B|nr:head-tail adaptor protein [Macrococcus sp. TMW 2.2395]
MNKLITIEQTTVSNVGGVQKKTVKKVCDLYAFFDTVWAKDFHTAVSNNTQHQIRMVTRQVPFDIDTNKCTVRYLDTVYKIIQILPDFYEQRFMTIIAERIG